MRTAVFIAIIFLMTADPSSASASSGVEDHTVTAIIAAIGGLFSAGSLLSKLVDWIRSDREKRAAAQTKIDVHTINAELTVNERLLVRINQVESQLAQEQRDHAQQRSITDEQRASLMLEISQLNRELDLEKMNAKNLLEANRELARDHARLESDSAALLEYAKTLEKENKRLRNEVGDEHTRPMRFAEITERTETEKGKR